MPPKAPKITPVVAPKMSRINPIAASKQTISGYPSKLVIYQLAASRFYWVRLYFNGKYHVESTRTESVKDAKAYAIKFYERILTTASGKHTTNRNKSFAIVGSDYMRSVEHNATPSVYRTDFSRYKNDLLPFFGEQEIDTITNSEVSGFIKHLGTRDLSPASIKHFMVVLRKIMKHAIANDLMVNLPVFPKISGRLQTTQKRDYLTADEYDRVVKSAEQLAQQNTVVRGVPLTLEMKYLIQFMVNSFLRPSDLRVLRHIHVKKMTLDGDEWLALSHPATKTTATEVQAMPASVFVYDRLLDFRKKSGAKPTLNDFVFLPTYANRDTAMAVIARLFRKIVDHALIESSADKNITLYSLRHTSIMMRLVNGNVNTLMLARNARTSQAMIDKFYAAHLTTDLVRKQLHAFNDRPAPATKARKKAKPTKPPTTN